MKRVRKKIAVISTMLILSMLVSSISAFAEEKSYDSSAGIQYKPGNGGEPVDPEEPEKPVKPIDPDTDEELPEGTKGPLSLDVASVFSFGDREISMDDKLYYAKAQKLIKDGATFYRGNYVQISDTRGNSEGWTVSVKQNGQLRNDSAKKYKVLNGAYITIGSATLESKMQGVAEPTINASLISGGMQLDPDGNSHLIMNAAEDEGTGTWIAYFGVAEEDTDDSSELKGSQINKAVSLFVPGSTPKDAVKYTTTLTWTIASLPE